MLPSCALRDLIQDSIKSMNHVTEIINETNLEVSVNFRDHEDRTSKHQTWPQSYKFGT